MKRGKVKKRSDGDGILGRWHKNPLNLLLYTVAFVLLIYGLWQFDARIMLGALAIAFIGYMVQQI